MERETLVGNLLFLVSAVAEMLVLGALFQMPSRLEGVILTGVLLVIPAFVVAYVVGRFGILYGLALGVMPAILALTVFPEQLFGFSRVADALILFVACMLLSVLSGFSGQSWARRSHAA